MNKIHMIVVFFVGVLIAIVGLQVMGPTVSEMETPLYDTPSDSIEMVSPVETLETDITLWQGSIGSEVSLGQATADAYTFNQYSADKNPVTPSYFTLEDYYNSPYWEDTNTPYELNLITHSDFNYTHPSTTDVCVTYEVLYVDENNVLIDRVDFGEINCNEIDNLSSLGEDIATPVYASVLSEDYQDIRYFYINETFVSTDETTNKTVENLNEPSLEWNYNIYQDGTVFGHSTGAGLLFAVPLVFATAIVIFAVSYIRKMD